MESKNPLAVQKAQLRVCLKQIRAEIPADRRAKFSKVIARRLFALEQVRAAQSLFVYISAGNEVETHGILRSLLAEGKRVLVPKIIGRRMLACHFTGWEDLQPGGLDILVPVHAEPYEGRVDIAVTPGLGFTVEGHRLGFGAGYYDQWFASHQVRLKVALSFEVQIVGSIPVDSCDIPVDVILTEQRTIRVDPYEPISRRRDS